METVTNQDRLRRTVVTLAEVFCVFGTLVGTGVIGTRVAESSGGALAADATLLAPAGPAFSIWSVIYLGLFAYTVYQWLPAQAASPRQRRIGWLAALSMVLNAVWLLVTQQGWIVLSVAVIVALVLSLALLMRHLAAGAGTTLVERVIVDGTFGLYLGWVSVATAANITAAAVASGVNPSAGVAELVAVLVLVVVAGLGVLLAFGLAGRWSVACASAWGLAWIAVGRLTDQPRSTATAAAALVAAGVTLGAVAEVRRRRSAPTAVLVSADS